MSGDLWLPASAMNRGYVEQEGDWEELPIPAHVAAMLEPGTRRYRYLECTVLVSKDPYTDQWHLSISHTDRYPTWDEISGARYQFIPDEVTMVQVLPPRGDYTNVHPNVFHLWEIEPDPRFTKEGS